MFEVIWDSNLYKRDHISLIGAIGAALALTVLLSGHGDRTALGLCIVGEVLLLLARHRQKQRSIIEIARL